MNSKNCRWWSRALGVCLCVMTSGVARAQVAPVRVAELPKAILEQLKDAYPGWTMVASEGGCDGATTGLMVTADLDNDQTPDYGLVIATPDGKKHILAIVPRVDEAVIHELGAWTAAPDMVRLHVLPMGRKYRGAGGTVDDYFSARTLGVGTCAAATTAFVWTGVRFLPTVLQALR